MFSAVRSQHNGVDICINNAGLARPDTLLSGSTSGWKDMFNVRAEDLAWGLGGQQGARGSWTRALLWMGCLARGSFGFLPGAPCRNPCFFPCPRESEWMNGHIFSILLSFEPLGVVLKA